jgi:magnesium and cobalt transporter
MQKAGESLVGVVNEYGGVIGMVTLEDVLEQVVGDIEDEYDTVSPLIRKIGPQRFIVDARIEVEKLNELLTSKIPPGDYETLCGYLTYVLQKVPVTGDKYVNRKITFSITRANPRSIEEVEIVLA